jgi:hypothetical protein
MCGRCWHSYTINHASIYLNPSTRPLESLAGEDIGSVKWSGLVMRGMSVVTDSSSRLKISRYGTQLTHDHKPSNNQGLDINCSVAKQRKICEYQYNTSTPLLVYCPQHTEKIHSLFQGRVHVSAHWLNEVTECSQLWCGDNFLKPPDTPQNSDSEHFQTNKQTTIRPVLDTWICPSTRLCMSYMGIKVKTNRDMLWICYLVLTGLE